MPNTIDPDISGLAAYPGTFSQQLLSKLYFTLVQMTRGFLPMYGIKNKTNLSKLLIGAGVKPYSGQWVPKNDLSFSNRWISTETAQRDLSIEPKKYKNTWMAEQMGKGSGANNQTIPFASFVWEKVVESIITELVSQTIYLGVGKDAFVAYNSTVAYSVGAYITYTQDGELRYFECITATTAGQSPDTNASKWIWAGAKALCKGLKAIFTDDITAGTLTPISTGAITSTTAYAQFLQMWRGMPIQVRDAGGIIHCSYNSYDCLNDNFEDKVSKYFEIIDGITYLAKTDRKCIIQPQVWLGGSGRLICTKDQNLVLATDQLSDLNDIRTVPAMYSVNAGITFLLGVNYQDEQVLRINDQA